MPLPIVATGFCIVPGFESLPSGRDEDRVRDVPSMPSQFVSSNDVSGLSVGSRCWHSQPLDVRVCWLWRSPSMSTSVLVARPAARARRARRGGVRLRRAGRAARAAVLGVLRQVDARRAAEREARVAVRLARAVRADLLGRARRPQRAAVLRIGLRVDARAGADAFTVRAGALALRATDAARARGAAGAAVGGVGLEVDAHAVTRGGARPAVGVTDRVPVAHAITTSARPTVKTKATSTATPSALSSGFQPGQVPRGTIGGAGSARVRRDVASSGRRGASAPRGRRRRQLLQRRLARRAPAPGARPKRHAVEHLRDIRYHEGHDREHLLDVYRPVHATEGEIDAPPAFRRHKGRRGRWSSTSTAAAFAFSRRTRTGSWALRSRAAATSSST